MTTSEALAAIPAIVEAAIPMTPLKNIKCPTEKAIAIQNARYRRNELTSKIQALIFRHEGNASVGVRIDLNELLKEKDQ